MRSQAIAAAATAVAGALGVFAARRVTLLLAALAPPPHRSQAGATTTNGPPRTVCLVVPARDEAAVLGRSLPALARATGPQVSVVLVSDGSSDDTFATMRQWADGTPGWHAMDLRSGVGKGAALNAGIAAGPDAELIAICDADVVVGQDSLRALTRAFNDPQVGAATGLLWPANPDQSIVTRYCALELWQHQLVTSAGKERLRLNPPAHGWFACYRREALQQIGWFPGSSLGEDVEATNALLSAGWETRFVAGARVISDVPATIGAYWRQHVRWSRGLHDAAPHRDDLAELAPVQRLETLLHAAGYADRVAFLAAVGFATTSRLPRWVPVGYAGLTMAEALAALALAGRLKNAPRFAVAAALMFALDASASATGSVLQLTRRTRRWNTMGRPIAE